MKTSIARILALLVCLTVASVGLQARESEKDLAIQVGVGVPSGDFGDVAGVGFGGIATFLYGVGPMFDLTGAIGYMTFGAKDKDVLDYSLSDVPIVVGGRYTFSNGGFAPYGGLELGLHMLTFKTQIFGLDVSSSETKFGIAPMVGFRSSLGNGGTGLDVNVKYNVIMTEGSSTSFIGINAGISFPL